jgi:hypothetical protein
VGSYSLHTDKTGIFRAALNAITKAIADTLNRHLVPGCSKSTAGSSMSCPSSSHQHRPA